METLISKNEYLIIELLHKIRHILLGAAVHPIIGYRNQITIFMFPNTLPTKIISIVQFRILLDILFSKKKGDDISRVSPCIHRK